MKRKTALIAMLGIEIVLIPVLIVILIAIVRSGAVNNKVRLSHATFWAAAKSGDMANVQELVEQGIDVNARPTGGHAALEWAVINGHGEIAEFLIRKGAHVNPKTENGKTPLDLARSDEMKALLRKHGAKAGEQPKDKAQND